MVISLGVHNFSALTEELSGWGLSEKGVNKISGWVWRNAL